MTLTQLSYALAVMRLRHFGKAADYCHVTQPTLSMQIQKLEDDLGIQLFDRQQHPVEPTQAGKHLLLQAERIMTEANKLDEMVNELKGSLKGRFRLGIIPTLAGSLLYRFIPKLSKAMPEMHFEILEMQTDTIVDQLRQFKLDAAILATPLNEKDLVEIPVFYEPFMAYVPEGHRLQSEAFVLHSELDARDILLLDEGHCFRNSVLQLCSHNQEEDSKRKIHLASGNFDSLIKLAKLGYGMTLLPYLTAADLPKEEQKALKPIDHPIPTREVSIMYHQSHYKLAIVRKLAEVLATAVPARLHDESHAVVPPR